MQIPLLLTLVRHPTRFSMTQASGLRSVLADAWSAGGGASFTLRPASAPSGRPCCCRAAAVIVSAYPDRDARESLVISLALDEAANPPLAWEAATGEGEDGELVDAWASVTDIADEEAFRMMPLAEPRIRFTDAETTECISTPL